MGVTTEQWRAIIGRWRGGKPGKRVLIEDLFARRPDNGSNRWFSLFVLASLLVIGCVELNPGPNSVEENTAMSLHGKSLPKYIKRPGTGGQHGELYEKRITSLLFARGLNRTEEFHLASNMGGAAGAFDDLVFKYKLKDDCRTCFIQLKHKKNNTEIKRSSLMQLSGDFSLFKYFQSYCKIKMEGYKDDNLRFCGSFENFEFLIYTNGSLKSNFVVDAVDTGLANILSSGPNHGVYTAFDENLDKDVFHFFEEVSRYCSFLRSLGEKGECAGEEYTQKIQNIRSSFKCSGILDKLDQLKSDPGDNVLRKLTKELEKCDFTLFPEFLQKLKIFHSQSNKDAVVKVIKGDLSDYCHTSSSSFHSPS